MILINGDSWTGGPTYKNLTDHWPYQMAEKYNLQMTNLAFGGVSNQRIFRTTIEYLYNNKELPTHLIIGWSTRERYELPSVEGYYMRITSSACEWFVDIPKKVPSLEIIRELFYKHMYHEELMEKSFINNLLIIQDICKLKDIKLLNFFSAWSNKTLLENQQVDKSTWILDPSTSMDLYLRNKGFGRTPSHHTDVQGQQYWADFVHSHL